MQTSLGRTVLSCPPHSMTPSCGSPVDHALVAEETSSWAYRHDRDLTGSIDGSENPSLIDAPDAALIPEGGR